MSELLKNPPLVEAVCEFQFDPSSKWDWTLPGRLFDKIGKEFSERMDVHRMGLTIQQASGKVSQSSIIEAGPDRIQLKRPDGSAMIQVGPRQLIINHLRPYPNWNPFRELILRMYETYNSLIEGSSLGRIGLRYINQIELTGKDYKEIINVWPTFSHSLKKEVSTLFQRYELKHDNPEGLLIHQTGLIQVEDKNMLVLDLDFVASSVSSITSRKHVADWLDQAHDRVEESFIDSLTPSAYKRLKEGKE
jgi:uncharacterized protein (TIGR04255 family)